MNKTSSSLDRNQLSILWSNTEISQTRVGQMIHAKTDRLVGKSLALYGEWAQNEINILLNYIKLGDFVIDIGASVGFHSLSFASKVGKTGRVWAFEPDPVNGLLLRLNIVSSELDEVVVPFDIAVSERVELRGFETFPLAHRETVGGAAVDATDDYPRVSAALDLLDLEMPPALIKIDVEGHELAALRGMQGLLERHRPVVSIEASDDRGREELAQFMGELGFDVYDFVTHAFNHDNFCGRRKNVWKNTGRAVNLLCVWPPHHEKPEGLRLRRPASTAHVTATYGSALRETQPAILDEFRYVPSTPTNYEGGWTAWKSLRGEIRTFVTGFLKTGIAQLDPAHYREVVEYGLDYLSADSVQRESAALQDLMLSALKALDGASTRARDLRAKAEGHDAEAIRRAALDSELTLVRADLARLRDDNQTRIRELEAGAVSAEADLETARTHLATFAIEKQAAEARQEADAAELKLLSRVRRELEERVAASEQSLAEGEARAATLAADKQAAEARQEADATELKLLSRIRHELEERLATAEESFAEAAARAATLAVDKQAADARHEADTAELNLLSRIRRDLEERLAASEERLAEAEARAATLAVERYAADERHQASAAELDTLGDLRRQLEEQLAASERRFATSQERSAEAETRAAMLAVEKQAEADARHHASAAELGTLGSARRQLEEQLAASERRFAALEERLAEAEARAETLAVEKQAADEGRQASATELAALDNARHELEERLTVSEERLADVQARAEVLAAEKQAADRRHQASAKELDALGDVRQQLEDRLTASQQRFADLESRARRLDADLAAMKAAHDDVSADKSVIAAAKAELEKRVAAQSQEIRRLRALA